MSSSAVAADTVFDAEAANARRRWITARVIIYGLLTLFSLIYIMPLIVVILNSFRDLPEINHNGLIAWPRSFNPIYWYQAWDT
jgi:glucose/mannose transport system permease protein